MFFFPFHFGHAAHSLFRQTINLVANLPPEDESSKTLQRTWPRGWQGGGLISGSLQVTLGELVTLAPGHKPACGDYIGCNKITPELNSRQIREEEKKKRTT